MVQAAQKIQALQKPSDEKSVFKMKGLVMFRHGACPTIGLTFKHDRTY
jgi:hypothetical protein